MKRILSVIVLASLFSLSAFAEDKSSGCGLGWSVTKKISLSATTTRNTTHSVLPPTFSMTSGSSNCDKHSIVQRHEASAVFAMTNDEALRLDMAAGGGEYVEGFARTFGCNDRGSALLASALQKNYASIVEGGASALVVTERVEAVIAGDRGLSAACSAKSATVAMNTIR